MPDHEVLGRLHIVEMIESLVTDEGACLMIGRDPDNGGGSRKATRDYSVSAWNGRMRKHGVASTLEGAIEACTPHPRMKICLREDCKSAGQPKSLWCFGPDRDSADGHAGVCRECEAKRIGALSRRKKRAMRNEQPTNEQPSSEQPSSEQPSSEQSQPPGRASERKPAA